MHSCLLLTLKEDGYTLRIELNEQQRLSINRNSEQRPLIIDSDQVCSIKEALLGAERLSCRVSDALTITEDNIFVTISTCIPAACAESYYKREDVKICFPLTDLQRQIFIHMCEQHLGTFQYYD